MDDDVRAWREAAATGTVDAALRGIHGRIAEETRAARPLCVASGTCCRFEAYGHRLYVTGLETAWFLRRLEADAGRSVTRAEIDAAISSGSCPFLHDGLCSVHSIRPFACRTFFCDPRATAWQTELHERCHREVQELHDSLGVPYRYAEWRTVLGMFAHGTSRREGR